jgi:hypothetical protein
MRIIIETLPHAEQRYDTVGDWYVDAEGTWQIRISALGNWKQEMLVAMHELVEMALCQAHDVTSREVDAFDLHWKAHHDIDEPGDDLTAPYYQEHQIATALERFMAVQLGVAWSEYYRALDEL